MEVDPVQDVPYDKAPPKEEAPEEPQEPGTEENREIPEEDGKAENVDYFA